MVEALRTFREITQFLREEEQEVAETNATADHDYGTSALPFAMRRANIFRDVAKEERGVSMQLISLAYYWYVVARYGLPYLEGRLRKFNATIDEAKRLIGQK